MMSMPEAAWLMSTLVLEMSGVSRVFTSSALPWRRGTMRVTTRSSMEARSPSRRVATFFERACTEGTILITEPLGTAAKPFTSSTDSNTR